MKRVLIALILVLVFISFISCSGDGGSESIDPAWEKKIKTILLNQKEWRLEWSSNSGYSGWAYLTFEDSGNEFMVNIDNRDARMKCKNKVTFTSEGFKMAGCRQSTSLLIFDPNDQMYPFKGDIQEYTWKIRAL